jgi:hypothetical protein
MKKKQTTPDGVADVTSKFATTPAGVGVSFRRQPVVSLRSTTG